MNDKVRVKGRLSLYMQWPLFLSALLVIVTMVVGAMDIRAGAVMSGFTVLYILIALWIYLYQRKNALAGMVEFSSEYAWIQKQLLSEMMQPYGIADEKGRLLWMNQAFAELLGVERHSRKSLMTLFPEMTKALLEDRTQAVSVHTEYQGRKYRMDLKWVALKDAGSLEITLGKEFAEEYLLTVYLADETEVLQYKKEINDQKLVAGLIYLDNYDEALESVEEVRRSLLTALIDRKVNKYISAMGGVVKKLEKDKYFFIVKQHFAEKIMEDRFTILEDVKTVNIGNDMAVTLSIGMGMNGDSYIQNYEYARASIDMALGRGGDQAVVKDGEKIQYFGGKAQQMEKSTRVKARVKAHALRELLESKDRLLIMGHKMPDIDSLGAALGIYRIATSLNKKANIVINEATMSIQPMLDRLRESPDHPDDLFLNGAKAAELVDANTILVVVDVNRPSITDSAALLRMVKTIVVLDHHRQSSEIIENAVLSYVEPYASSACEMVAEVLQYIADGIRIKPVEADAMYAGIVVDTNSFTNQTGVRTFEAAAFLRRSGADVTRVRKLFRDNMAEYQAKADAVRRAEIYRDGFVISVCHAEGLNSPTVVGAQAANDLLEISGIKASVVLTEYNHVIYASARSIDEVNVQVMMEHLGGGGHRTVAGAQLEGVDELQARLMVKKVIDEMLEKGEVS